MQIFILDSFSNGYYFISMVVITTKKKKVLNVTLCYKIERYINNRLFCKLVYWRLLNGNKLQVIK